ncbi:chlorinating enzyme [Xenorhabdus bovienii]|uniref:Chlorinating enzyme n=1 Tax=Xenorhabdus bovienii TaxID=40576 RepID=A0AAJ1J9H6_XENBV|nr:chlorinating enzyme [Xenorhabdus bovienii]MDE1477853.1 chlorinating enzyme [Xenorhabdus bovienii]MDE1488503.1 chlorinating enzyme [Xenorhabdus bovienii]MDE1490705.1 chlorinating enzyme [Xenorhabdus bovienii]MDE1495894.1 chlorinating enzyme [Xenorhabdus bovienii]MDE9473799.1 chlorinating enzyme [Xenorhabdus bovienii]
MNKELQLTEEQLASFHKNGFIGPLTIYSPEEMAEIWNNVRRQLPDRSHAAYPADSYGAATNISNYDRHLDIQLLSQHITNPHIVAPVSSILGNDVLCWRTEFFPKYPGDEGTDWHQADTFANASGKPQILWPGETEEQFGKGTLTVWTAFTDATIENGCLEIIPGTHLKMNYDETKSMAYQSDIVNKLAKDGKNRGFFGYDYRNLQVDPEWKPDENQAVPLVMKAGQCVIFWSTLMHASYPNTSEKHYRMGFATRYAPSYVDIYPNTDHVYEYGGNIPLDKFGCVIVSGQSRNTNNRIASHNLLDQPFIPLLGKMF